jgi:hypothetical protein
MPYRVIQNTVLAAASQNLTDLATVKAELQLVDTAQDAFLTLAIPQVSAAISNYCNRTFLLETVQDQFMVDGGPYAWRYPAIAPLQSSRYPIQGTVTTVPTTGSVAIGGTSIAFATASLAGVSVGAPVVGSGIPMGAYVASLVGSPATGVMVSQAATAVIPVGSSISFGPAVWETDPSGTATQLAAGTDYTVNAKTGQLFRQNGGAWSQRNWSSPLVTAFYQGGYTTIPSDVVTAALRTITQRFFARGRDPYLKSRDQQGMGSQTFWVGGLPGVSGSIPQEIADMLDNYRVPLV